MKNANFEIAKKLIQESKQAGTQEMSIRRTNAGLAGSIAEKITARQKFAEVDGEVVELPIDEQASELAQWLTKDEVEYAKNW